jgi:hypothetical protein
LLSGARGDIAIIASNIGILRLDYPLLNAWIRIYPENGGHLAAKISVPKNDDKIKSTGRVPDALGK